MTWYYPVPAVKSRALNDSFNRRYVPGTQQPYARGKHGGIDIGCPDGSTVHAVKEGIVARTGAIWGPSYGKQILIKHPSGHYTFYAHFSKITVQPGQRITAGQRIGASGHTGNVFGPHVHFELHSTPYWTTGLINPYDHLEAARKAMLK